MQPAHNAIEIIHIHRLITAIMKNNLEKNTGRAAKPSEAEVSVKQPEAAAQPAPEAGEQPSEAKSSPTDAPERATQCAADIDAAIADAEQRGYLRGRNERIEELMQRPGMMERPGSTELHQASAKSDNGFLSRLKVSIWDK